MVGLVMFAFGIALQVKSTLGLAPWEALHQGMSIHTPLSIGISGILTGVIVLVLWIPLHQRLGIGTVSNVIVIGLVIDGSLWLLGDISNVYLHWLYMLGGITLTGLGSGIYIGARLGPGPRDGLMTGLAERGISDSAGPLLHRGRCSCRWVASRGHHRHRHRGVHPPDRSDRSVLPRAVRSGRDHGRAGVEHA